MPHITIEYSAGLESVLDIDRLVDVVHEAALASGTAQLDALRTRALRCDSYAVADRHPDNGFVAVTVRLAPGRAADDRRLLAAALIDAVDDALGDVREHTMLSAEVVEIDPATRVNRNHLRPHVLARVAQTEHVG